MAAGTPGSERVYGQIMARIWTDEDFKRRFMSEPAEVLREEGVDIPQGVEVIAVENTPERVYISVPPRPEEVSEEDLETVAGGNCVGCLGCAGSVSTMSCPMGTIGTAACAGTAGCT